MRIESILEKIGLRQNPEALSFVKNVDQLVMDRKFSEAIHYVEENYEGVKGKLSRDHEAALAEKLEYAEMVLGSPQF